MLHWNKSVEQINRSCAPWRPFLLQTECDSEEQISRDAQCKSESSYHRHPFLVFILPLSLSPYHLPPAPSKSHLSPRPLQSISTIPPPPPLLYSPPPSSTVCVSPSLFRTLPPPLPFFTLPFHNLFPPTHPLSPPSHSVLSLCPPRSTPPPPFLYSLSPRPPPFSLPPPLSMQSLSLSPLPFLYSPTPLLSLSLPPISTLWPDHWSSLVSVSARYNCQDITPSKKKKPSQPQSGTESAYRKKSG